MSTSDNAACASSDDCCAARTFQALTSFPGRLLESMLPEREQEAQECRQWAALLNNTAEGCVVAIARLADRKDQPAPSTIRVDVVGDTSRVEKSS
ncbi:hypothetical protein [Patulibacter defluvii]|uniref:hypothetical protein n=1 Tax=Patulibacter defluvii TaxID=3095358 RepID=UPI002A75149A|nr:hypothetical protein [Patulibacter sp. DM4]